MAGQDPDFSVRPTANFAAVFGAGLVASMVNLFMYGVGLLMALQYFRRHSKDPIIPKGTVMILIILVTLQTIFASHEVYYVFVVNDGQTAKLDNITFSVPAASLCAYLAAFVAQGYFCTVIWNTGRRLHTWTRFAVVPVILLAFVHLAGGMAQVVVMVTSHAYSVMLMRAIVLNESTTIQGLGTALADIISSAALCYILHTSRSGLRRTNSMINKLITYAINRAIVTSFCAVVVVILYNVCPATCYFMIPLYMCTQLYLISVVSMLTSREGLREEEDPSFHVSNLEMSATKGSVIVGSSEASSQITSGPAHEE